MLTMPTPQDPSQFAKNTNFKTAMYLYLGKVGSGYRWALWPGGEHVYLYERSSATKWRTKYVGKHSVRRLPRELKLALLRAVGRLFVDFFEGLARLAAAHSRARLFAEEYREELVALGLLDDDG